MIGVEVYKEGRAALKKGSRQKRRKEKKKKVLREESEQYYFCVDLAYSGEFVESWMFIYFLI